MATAAAEEHMIIIIPEPYKTKHKHKKEEATLK
jgi:hypothetical protein